MFAAKTARGWCQRDLKAQNLDKVAMSTVLGRTSTLPIELVTEKQNDSFSLADANSDKTKNIADWHSDVNHYNSESTTPLDFVQRYKNEELNFSSFHSQFDDK